MLIHLPDLLKNLETLAIRKLEIQQHEVHRPSRQLLETVSGRVYGQSPIALLFQGLLEEVAEGFFVVYDKDPTIHRPPPLARGSRTTTLVPSPSVLVMSSTAGCS